MILNVYIKKNSTLSIVKYPLTEKLLDKYFITDDMLSNCAVTFSMIKADTGIFEIANVEAELLYLPDRATYPNDEKYSVVYRFKKNQIKNSGIYHGEFTIDFLGQEQTCYSITLPIEDFININIIDTITKTTVY